MLTLKEQTMLGNIPGDWQAKPLLDLLDDHLPGDWGDDAGPDLFKVLRSTNLTNTGRLDFSDVALRALPPKRAQLFSPKGGDILLERSGGGPGQPVGRVGFVERDLPGYGYSNFLHLLRTDSSKINPRFLAWTLYQVNRTGRIIRLEQQTTQLRNLHFRDYLTMRVALPSPEEQTAIARLLDSVDRAITQAIAAIDAADVLRESLIAELLSAGVDTNGRVRDSDVSAADFCRTPMGVLPATWRPSTLEAEFEIKNGITLNEAQRARHPKRRYLRVANVQRDALKLDDVKELEASDHEVKSRFLALDDLLVVEGHADRMQIGRCARVTEQAVGMTFQNHLFRLRSKGEVLPAFGCLWLNSSHGQRYWNARCATSSGLNTINQRMLKRLAMPVPSIEEQRLIADIIEKQRTHMDALKAKRDGLEKLKKSLLHDLLTGTVRLDPTLFAKAIA